MTKLDSWLEQTKFINDNGKGQLGQAIEVIKKLKSIVEFVVVEVEMDDGAWNICQEALDIDPESK